VATEAEVRERIYDALRLTREQRDWIDSDADGYQAARAEADRQREAFLEYARAESRRVSDELAARLGL
jgi:hypothetical protein